MPPLTHANAYGLHKRLCKDLGIDPLPKNRFRLYQTTHKHRYRATGTYDTMARIIAIVRPRLGRFDWRRVVAHETYHYYQAVKGWLRFGIRWELRRTFGCEYWTELPIPTAMWKGRDVKEWGHAYRATPWERGAFAYEARMTKKYGWRP